MRQRQDGQTNLDISPLFSPLPIKDKRLRNRIVMPPLVVNRRLTGNEGLEWYAGHARGGVGMVIVEATDVGEFESELTAQSLRPLVDGIHAGGALAAIQIFVGRRRMRPAPADLSREDLQRLVALCVKATLVCAEAGFDAVEPHGAHSYMLNLFFSRTANQRSDEYTGQTLAGRMRFGLDVAQAMAQAAHQGGMLMMYRHTPYRDKDPQGYSIDESVQFAAELVKAGVDVLDISPGGSAAPGEWAAPFKQLGVPVITVGHMDVLERAVETLNEQRADLIAVGRSLIADQDWPDKVRQGRHDEVIACTRCDQCLADVRAWVTVHCPEWYGREE
jgi:2,4-dienoyl-CoA reductase-like NADH-dependent reductase (Old Yellow Enzyme family)